MSIGSTSLDKLLQLFEDRIKGRFFGKYEGIVAEVNDPLHIGRIRAKVPAVFGDGVVTGWALPCSPFGGGKNRGFLFLPEIGDTVWIEFAAGDPSRPIWVGAFWGAPESAGGQDELASETGSEVPTADGNEAGPGRSVIRTRAGHRLYFDDEGEIVVLASGDDKTEIRLTKDGEVVITADKIKLGAEASQALVLGDEFMKLFNQHKHLTGTGASGPPVQPMRASHLSKKTFTE